MRGVNARVGRNSFTNEYVSKITTNTSPFLWCCKHKDTFDKQTYTRMAQFLPLQSKHSNKLGKIKAFCILFQVISEFWVCTLCTQHQKSIWETTADQIVALSRLYVLFHVSFYICKEIRVGRCIFEIILETNFFGMPRLQTSYLRNMKRFEILFLVKSY